jgi:glycosyltransferase involved in cell wall biosynthesis
MTRPDTLIIVPAFNEVASLPIVLRDLGRYSEVFDVIVVDDGSSDGTAAVARAAGFAVLPLPMNMGNGVAVQTGLKFAQRHGYQFAAQFDADGQHLVDGLIRVLAAARGGEADVVVGSRFVGDPSFRSTFLRRLGIRFFSGLLRLVSGVRVHDSTSGLRVFNRRAVDRLVDDYPDHFPDADVLLSLARGGCRIVEVPVTMRPRMAGNSKTNVGRSVYYPFRVALGMLIALLRARG